MASLLQSARLAQGNSTTVAIALAGTTAGSFLVAYVGSSTAGRNCTASDNVNGAYNLDTTGGGLSHSINTFPNNAGGALTITGTISGASTAIAMIVEEWSGVATVSPLDLVPAIASGSAVTTLTSNATGTLSQSNELILTSCKTNAAQSVGNPLVQSPFTQDPIGTIPSAAPYLGTGYQIVSSTASTTSTFNWNASSTCNLWIATYKLASVNVTNPVMYSRKYILFNT